MDKNSNLRDGDVAGKAGSGAGALWDGAVGSRKPSAQVGLVFRAADI